MAQETGQQGNVQTVAQFLLGTRFDADTGRYYTNAEAPKTEATTCIVDESSMLTEDMLAAIVDAIPANAALSSSATRTSFRLSGQDVLSWTSSST